MAHHSIIPMPSKDAASSEHLQVMMEQERTTYSCRDYLRDDRDGDGGSGGDRDDGDDGSARSGATFHLQEPPVTPADRAELTNWCFTLVDHCRFHRETAAMAVNLFGRFAGASTDDAVGAAASLDRATYHLSGVAAMHIAVKLNERIFFPSCDLAAMSPGLYSAEDVHGMELKMLHALSWRVRPPTSFEAANHIITLMLPDLANVVPERVDLLRNEATDQVTRAVGEHGFVTRRPSTVAAAAVMNAIRTVGNQDDEVLMEALHRVLEKFPFEPYDVLLEAQDHLRLLADDEDDDDSFATWESEGSAATSLLEDDEESIAAREPETNQVPPLQEESRNAGVGEEVLPRDSRPFYRSMQDALEQMSSSPKSVM